MIKKETLEKKLQVYQICLEVTIDEIASSYFLDKFVKYNRLYNKLYGDKNENSN